MTLLSFRVKALERLILSRTSATAGLHECLDYIPGAVIQGCFAAMHYEAWKSSRCDDLFNMFHSGLVSFGDAHPCLPNGKVAIPVPLSYHQAKPKPAAEHAENPPRTEIRNLALSAWPKELGQPVQMRTGWMDTAGRSVHPRQGRLLKTARDTSRRGVPEESRLFAYHYLEAGQEFAGEIRISDKCKQLADEIRTWIGDTAIIRIGRSHQAEFGRCELTLVEPDDSHNLDEGDLKSRPNRVCLLAVSDLWFPDGMPAEGKAFHPALDSYQLEHDKTFARFRSYAPWNAYRGFPDPERQVVTRGSVLTFTFHGHEPDKTLKQLRELMSDGVGNGRAEGLGKVWVNPPVLASETYSTSPMQHPAIGDGTEASRPSTPVLAVIEQRWTRRWVSLETDRLATQFVEAWKSYRPRPKRSQWAQLRQMARAASAADDFSTQFSRFSNEGAAKWKWSGTQQGMGQETLAKHIAGAWKSMAKTSDKDPRSKIESAREQAFLAAVAEAARRLRDA